MRTIHSPPPHRPRPAGPASPWPRRVAAALLVMLLGACSQGGGGPANAGDAPGVGDVARGEELYAASCAQCHGADATGTDQGPPFIHQVYVPSHHADVSFLLAVRNGVQPHHWDFGPMPPRPELSEAQVTDIVAYVRSLQRAAGLIE